MKTVEKSRYFPGKATVMVLSALVSLASAMPVFADLNDSNFEIGDGNLKVDIMGKQDWNTILPPDPQGPNPPYVFVDEPSGSGDDSFGQGTKEDDATPSVVTGSIPPNKSDLKEFGVYFEENGDGRFLHLFWTRVQDPSGTTNMDFEFNQSSDTDANGLPIRTAGDALVVYELSKGGTVPIIAIALWIDGSGGETADDCEAANSLPCWSALTPLGALAAGSINTEAIPAGESDLGALDARTFGEATIDFGELIGASDCFSFGSAHLKSRSSDAFTSALKDFIAPQEVNVSNCGSIPILKVDDQGYGIAGVVFNLFAESGVDDTAYNPGDDTATTYSCQTDANGACSISGVLAGDYWIVEDASSVPAGFGTMSSPQAVTVEPGVTISTPFEFENPVIKGSIVIQKTTVPASTVDFAFNPSWTDSTWAAGSYGLAHGESNTTMDLLPSAYDGSGTAQGAYSVSEVTPLPAGWTQTSATCSDGSDPSSIDLAADETVTCTFVNRLDGKIIVDKVTEPSGSSQTFEFTPSYGATFMLTDGDSPNDSGFLTPGTYSVSESVPTGWNQISATCSDGSDPSSIDLAPGEIVTCTFTNRQESAIIVDKVTDPPGSGVEFTFSSNYGSNFVLTDAATPNNSGPLAPGTYNVSETVPEGWVQTSATCSDGSDPASIALAAGETVTCTFNNRQDGKIIVDKVTDPTGSTQAFSFTSNYDAPFMLDDDDPPNESGFLTPGTYSVSETPVVGWNQTSATCSDGSDPSSIDLGAGETVTCTFTNTVQRGAIKIIKTRKHAADGSGDHPHAGVVFNTTAVAGDLVTDMNGEICIDGVILSTVIGVGDYSVTENVPGGYVADGDTTKTVSVTQESACGDGNEATVSFANTPLTNFTVSVDSQVNGGTASTISCTGPGESAEGQANTDSTGDGMLTVSNKLPGTYTCVIVIDP